MIFPVLPRCYTQPFRAKARTSTNSADSEPRPSQEQEKKKGKIKTKLKKKKKNDLDEMASTTSSHPSSADSEGHDHELLESLFYSVFETRSINLKPTGQLITR